MPSIVPPGALALYLACGVINQVSIFILWITAPTVVAIRLLPAVIAGQADVMWDTLFYTPERAQKVDFVTYLSATSAYWPGNAWSLFPLLTATPTRGTTFYLGAQYMSRLSTSDAFYYQPQIPIALSGIEAHGVMTQIYSRLRWQPDQHWSLSATMIYQAAGAATNEAGGEDVFISSASLAWRF